MATKQVKIKGKVRWAKVFEENRDKRGFEDAYLPYDGAYTVDVELDKDNFMILADLGSAKASKLKQKEVDKFGVVTLKFVRKHKDRFDWASGAPMVRKPDGTPWSYAADGVVPNDSEAVITVDVYTTSKATGTRLVAVDVETVADYSEEKPATSATYTTVSKPSEEILF